MNHLAEAQLAPTRRISVGDLVVKVHLVDGTYELYRAFYGTPPKRASDGAEMGAVRGLLRSMMVLLAEPDVTHVAIAFDHVIESFRNRLYPGYKTGEGIDPDLYSQFGPAEDATRALGMVTWPMIEFEADDAIATAALRFAASPAVEQVVICSPDKDLTQCVNGDRIVCRDRMRGTTLDGCRRGGEVRCAAGLDTRLARAGRGQRRWISRHCPLGREIRRGGARGLQEARSDSRRPECVDGESARRRRAGRQPACWARGRGTVQNARDVALRRTAR